MKIKKLHAVQEHLTHELHVDNAINEPTLVRNIDTKVTTKIMTLKTMH